MPSNDIMLCHGPVGPGHICWSTNPVIIMAGAGPWSPEVLVDGYPARFPTYQLPEDTSGALMSFIVPLSPLAECPSSSSLGCLSYPSPLLLNALYLLSILLQ